MCRGRLGSVACWCKKGPCWSAPNGGSGGVGPLAAPAGQHPAGGGSDGQRIELAHGPRRDPRAGQGAEARAPIGAVAFPPRLGWREVPIHRPTQGRPLPPRARPVMAPMAQPQPKVPPAPRGADPRQLPGAAPLASVRRGPVRAERRRPSAALRRRRPPPQPPARGRGVGGIKRPPPQQRRRFRIRPRPASSRPLPPAYPPRRTNTLSAPTRPHAILGRHEPHLSREYSPSPPGRGPG
jgi:hypothetical protein